MFELALLKRIVVANKVESKQLYKIFLNLLLLKNETFSQMFLQGTEENLSSYYLSLQKDYLTFLTQYFIKKGKKTKVENLFRKFFFKLKKRKNPSRRWAKKTWRSFLKCKYNAMYYVRLKIRKRRRRVKYRVTYLESYRWLKKSVLPLAKTVKESKLRTFSDAFYKEFLMLRSGKSGITTKRNEYHKLAYMRAPYSWKRERKSKQTRQKSATWRFFKVWNRKIRKRKWAVWLKKFSAYSNKVKKSITKKRFNKWVSQYLVNVEIFQQSRQNLKKSETILNLKDSKGVSKNALFKQEKFLFKNGQKFNNIIEKNNSFFTKVRLFLYTKNRQESKSVLIKFPLFAYTSYFHINSLNPKNNYKVKLNSKLLFGKNSSRREKFVKKYLLPQKGVSKVDLSKPYPAVTNKFFAYNFKKKRIKNKRAFFSANGVNLTSKLRVLEKNIFVKKVKKLNRFGYAKSKESKFVAISSFVSKDFEKSKFDIKFVKNLLKGKNSPSLFNISEAGKNLKQKSSYDHAFKNLTFFSVILVWKFLETRLVKNLTLNEYKKIEKDLLRKKKYQFIKKMFYYVKMLYRDLYKI